MRLAVARKTEVALRVLRALEVTDGRLQVAELADRTGATVAYLPQAVAPLVRAGWVESAPGPYGGYRLVVDVASLSLLDVVSAVEGLADGSGCPCGSLPHNESCCLRDRWQQARQGLVDALAAIPLDCDFERSIVGVASTSSNQATQKEAL